MGKFTIDYNFLFEDNQNYNFPIELDQESLIYTSKKNTAPNWAELDYQKCSNCPFNSSTTKYCPVALNLSEIVDCFHNVPSYKKVTVSVHTPERTYSKSTDIQHGLLSAFGVIMASSGCPHFEIFRPLVRFHLPFASLDETLFRVVSIYFLSCYFTEKNSKGEPPTFPEVMTLLKDKYEEVENVNSGMLCRIRKFVQSDADNNAFIGLNNFAQLFSIEFETNFLDSLGNLFNFKKDSK